MKKLNSNKCNVAVRLMLIFIIILIIILGVFLYFGYYGDFAEKDAKTEPEETVPPTEEKREMDYERIKEDIATGKLDEVPEGIDKTENTIIREYLSDCFRNEYLNQQLECYGEHYFNYYPELKEQKNNCEQMQGNEKTQCFDQLYFKVASEKEFEFCHAIVDSDLKEECLKVG